MTAFKPGLYASMVAFVKMERLRLSTKLNHFAMKAKLYQAAFKSAFEQPGFLQANYLSA